MRVERHVSRRPNHTISSNSRKHVVEHIDDLDHKNRLRFDNSGYPQGLEHGPHCHCCSCWTGPQALTSSRMQGVEPGHAGNVSWKMFIWFTMLKNSINIRSFHHPIAPISCLAHIEIGLCHHMSPYITPIHTYVCYMYMYVTFSPPKCFPKSSTTSMTTTFDSK